MLICMAYFFLMAQYVTLLIILTGVSMIYVIMQNQKNGGVLAVGGFLILLILINLAGIFRFFAGVIESEIISRRLYEVAEFLAGGEMGVSMESRWDVYMEGLQYFIKSFLSIIRNSRKGNLFTVRAFPIWRETTKIIITVSFI